MSSFLESKFEETFTEEQKVVRAPGVRDTHIHCVFLILDPIRLDANISASRQAQQGAGKYSTSIMPRLVGGLDEDLDLQVLRTLQGKTTVIPVVSKADTITSAHMTFLKRTVWNSLKQAKIDPLEGFNISESSDEDGDEFDERDEDRYNQSGDEDEFSRKNRNRDTAMTKDIVNNIADPDSGSDYEGEHDAVPSGSPAASPSARTGAHRRQASAAMSTQAAVLGDNELPYLPLSILSPDMYDLEMSGQSNQRPGRRFPWGFADPYDPEHCDFVRLKDSVFSEWRAELREASRERWYEGWRTSRLKRHDGQRPMTVGTAGRGMDGGMRSPNGRPTAIYGAPGQQQQQQQNGKVVSMSAAERGRGYGGPGTAM